MEELEYYKKKALYLFAQTNYSKADKGLIELIQNDTDVERLKNMCSLMESNREKQKKIDKMTEKEWRKWAEDELQRIAKEHGEEIKRWEYEEEDIFEQYEEWERGRNEKAKTETREM